MLLNSGNLLRGHPREKPKDVTETRYGLYMGLSLSEGGINVQEWVLLRVASALRGLSPPMLSMNPNAFP